MIDSKFHLFVLEGLAHAGLKELYDKIPRTRSDESRRDMQVFFNADMRFGQRLYAQLDLDLLKIKLFESVEEIVKKPLLYVRDMTPKASYDALIKLNQVENR